MTWRRDGGRSFAPSGCWPIRAWRRARRLCWMLPPSSRRGTGITTGAGKIPFICFDLAGGGNIAGSSYSSN